MNMNAHFNIRKSLCLVMIGFVSVAEATVPPIPKGIVSMPPSGSNFPVQILNDAGIVGSMSQTSGLILKQQKAFMIGRL